MRTFELIKLGEKALKQRKERKKENDKMMMKKQFFINALLLHFKFVKLNFPSIIERRGLFDLESLFESFSEKAF